MELVKHETCQEYVTRRLSEGWNIVWQGGYHLILSSPDGNILRPVDLRNDVETLRPNAAGDETSIAAQYPASGEHWDKVDEVSADNDSTYVGDTTNAYKRDLYNLPAHSVGSGTINFIIIYFRCRHYTGAFPGHAKPSLKSDSTVTDGTETDLLATYATYSQQWNTNPADSEAWEWADIDALQIGVSLLSKSASVVRCTQVYVEVDYTPPAIVIPTVTTQAVTNIDTTTATGNGNITNTGGENCTKRGVCWNKVGNPTIADSKSEEADSFGTGAFERPMTGLDPGEHYYVKAYAYNSAGYGYGGQVEFTTLPSRYGFVNFQDPGIV